MRYLLTLIIGLSLGGFLVEGKPNVLFIAIDDLNDYISVSYTHLTLPTICSV